jgi:hypothetical protein
MKRQPISEANRIFHLSPFFVRSGRQTSRLCDNNFHLGLYTNGCSGYLPTAEELDCGGYEVYWLLLTEFIAKNRREYSGFG